MSNAAEAVRIDYYHPVVVEPKGTSMLDSMGSYLSAIKLEHLLQSHRYLALLTPAISRIRYRLNRVHCRSLTQRSAQVVVQIDLDSA